MTTKPAGAFGTWTPCPHCKGVGYTRSDEVREPEPSRHPLILAPMDDHYDHHFGHAQDFAAPIPAALDAPEQLDLFYSYSWNATPQVPQYIEDTLKEAGL